jgi:preprotein translocase SecF subunit
MSISTPTRNAAPALASPTGTRHVWPFMKWRFWAFGFTSFLFAITLASLGLQGLNLGLDFTGGVLVEASKDTPFDDTALRASLAAAGIEEASVQLADDGVTALIRVGLSEGVSDAETQALRQTVSTVVISQGAEVKSLDAVGPQVSGELFRNGLLASLAAVVLISLYIVFRFEWKFGIAVFITTFHDVILILGFYSILGLTFDLTSIAAILTIAGYSVNDKVVVFDRIREMLRKHKRMPLADLIDAAISATLSRTVVTGATTLIATFAILFFAGPVLFGFASAIIAGVVIGTYSSIFVAAPLLIHVPGKMPGANEEREKPSS